MEVHYDHVLDHALSIPTVTGASAALSTILGSKRPRSLLDVGCGRGIWLRAAVDLGISDVLGIDGADVASEILATAKTNIRFCDLSKPFSLGRRFDMALCLEVAEHLPEHSSDDLISSIVAHSDSVLFSAACPGQDGQNHINCRWPAYWQSRFNSHGFACDDSTRWQIWDNARIEPWYRQNIFWARRDPKSAGFEPRLKAVIHPEVHAYGVRLASKKYTSGIEDGYRLAVEQGKMPVIWYVKTSLRAVAAKITRLITDRKATPS